MFALRVCATTDSNSFIAAPLGQKIFHVMSMPRPAYTSFQNAVPN